MVDMLDVPTKRFSQKNKKDTKDDAGKVQILFGVSSTVFVRGATIVPHVGA